MTNRIRQIREDRGLSQQELADRVGTSNQQISLLERGERQLTANWMERLAKGLDVNPADLMGRAGDIQPARKPRSSRAGIVQIPEVDVRAGMGFGAESAVEYEFDTDGDFLETDRIVGAWQLPADYMRSELRVSPDASRIFEVQGDSMEPTLETGDRVLVNTADRLPSPPGLFALWDGFGVVVKRIEHLLNSDPPTLSIASDNPKHRTYERTAEEVNIIGRVKWVARRL